MKPVRTIPPISMVVIDAEHSAPAGEHPYRAIPELQDPERSR